MSDVSLFQFLQVFSTVCTAVSQTMTVNRVTKAQIAYYKTMGDFTFWLSPWLSLLAESKH